MKESGTDKKNCPGKKTGRFMARMTAKALVLGAMLLAGGTQSHACGPWYFTPLDLPPLYTYAQGYDSPVYSAVNYLKIDAYDEYVSGEDCRKKYPGYYRTLAEFGETETPAEAMGEWYYPEPGETERWKESSRELIEACIRNTAGKEAGIYAYKVLKHFYWTDSRKEADSFWASHHKDFEDSEFASMCTSLYAGILLNNGERSRALNLYADAGDLDSLTVLGAVSSNSGSTFIKDLFNRDSNHPLLAPLLQKYALYSAGAANPRRESKLKEDREMATFAQQASSSKTVTNPLMWANLAAYLNLYSGDSKKAQDCLSKSKGLKGSSSDRDVSRILRLAVYLNMQKKYTKEVSDYLTSEFKWLETLGQGGKNAAARISLEGIIPLYEKSGMQWAAGLLSQRIGKFYQDPFDFEKKDFEKNYYTEFMSAAETERMRSETKSVFAFEKYLASKVSFSEGFTEYVGTKYIREGNFEKALSYLEKLDNTFCYDNRMYSAARWFVGENIVNSYEAHGLTVKKIPQQKQELLRQWSKEKNKKAAFCREMIELLAEYKQECRQKSTDRFLTAYLLAVRYDQASHSGYCWYLVQDSHSTGFFTVKENQLWWGETGCDFYHAMETAVDFEMLALDYLAVAMQSPDKNLCSNARYASNFILENTDSIHSGQYASYRQEMSEREKQSVLKRENSACDTLRNWL